MPINKEYLNKFVATSKLVGRTLYDSDQTDIILYTILKEYHAVMLHDVGQEPKRLTKENNETIQNPNHLILDLIEDKINKLDFALRIHFYPKKVRV